MLGGDLALLGDHRAGGLEILDQDPQISATLAEVGDVRELRRRDRHGVEDVGHAVREVLLGLLQRRDRDRSAR